MRVRRNEFRIVEASGSIDDGVRNRKPIDDTVISGSQRDAFGKRFDER